MLITNLKISQDKKYPSFEAVKIRQINPKYWYMQRAFETELDEFVKNGNNVEAAGKGISATVYKFKKFQDFVFKKSKEVKTDFNDEIENLKSIPSYIKNVQRFVAQAFDDETGLFYLISTRMKGKSPDGSKAVWTREHLNSLFDTIFELDKNGIYHGDINTGNILLDEKGNANLIDFQWMQKLNEADFFKNKPKSVLPPFMLSENSQMFEMAAIPYYLPRCRDGKEFVKLYLNEKSEYHKKRYDFLLKLFFRWNNMSEISTIRKGLDFEKSQFIVLKNPDENTIRVETKKIQFLSAFREAFTRVELGNPDGNFPTAGSSHLLVMNYIKDLRKEISKQISKNTRGIDRESYLNLTGEYAKYWYDNISSWINDIFDYSIRRAISIGTSGEKIPDNFGYISNIAKYVDESYVPQYSRGFSIQYNTDTENILRDIKTCISRLNTYSNEIWYDDIYNKKLRQIIDVNNKLEKAYSSKYALDVVDLSVLDIVRNRELKELVSPKYHIHNRSNIITELHNLRLMHEDVARQNYSSVLNSIRYSDDLTGYKNMNNLD